MMAVQNADMVPHVWNGLNLSTVWEWFSIQHEMVHGKGQVEPFPKVVKRERVFDKLEPGFNGKTVKFPAGEFLFPDDIT